MGNSLLDFVMALVRDPAAAARYAADPAGALAAAGLPGVTITDVENLIPVVTDSLAMATPAFGDAMDAANVWTGAAAAAAFDAFDVPHPAPAAHSPQVSSVPADPAPDQAAEPTGIDSIPAPDAPVPDAGDSSAPEPLAQDWIDDGGWHPVHDPQPDHHPTDHPGFDLF